MTLESLLSNPLILLALGFVLSEWRSGRAGQTKAVQVDTDLLARVKFLETWVGDHNSIHGCVQSLKATTEGMAKNLDRMMRQWDQLMASASYQTPSARARSPFDFPGARDWTDPQAEGERPA